MNQRIEKIIDELVSLEPSFAAHRQELGQILLKLDALKPNIAVDPEFVRKLRIQLLEHAENKNFASTWSKLKNNFMKKTLFVGGSVAVLLLAVLVGLSIYGNYKNKSKGLLSFGTDVLITRTGEKAFGSLATLTAASGQGGGTSMAPTANSKSMLAYGMGGGGDMAIPYEPLSYKYVYKGDSLNLSSDKLEVLKRQMPDLSSIASSVNSFGLGLVNLDSFGNSKVQSVTIGQDKGYNIYMDLVNGMVSINGYFDPMPLATSSNVSTPSAIMCIKEGPPCGPPPISESDIPDDGTLISIANQFLSDHGITTTAYAAPEVQNQFRVQNKMLLQKNPIAQVYWPQYIEVVYPLQVDNGEVYDEGGNKTGLMVSIDISSKKVTSVSNLSTLNYQASSYDAETDDSRIVSVAEKGGLYGYVGDSNAKTVEIDLGTPTQQYVQMWDYSDNTSQQILVPSLIFPVQNPPAEGYYQQFVIVPLIKDILNRGNGVGGPVKIMGTDGTSTGVAPAPAIMK